MMLISCIVNYVSLKREKLLRLTNGFQTRLWYSIEHKVNDVRNPCMAL